MSKEKSIYELEQEILENQRKIEMANMIGCSSIFIVLLLFLFIILLSTI